MREVEVEKVGTGGRTPRAAGHRDGNGQVVADGQDGGGVGGVVVEGAIGGRMVGCWASVLQFPLVGTGAAVCGKVTVRSLPLMLTLMEWVLLSVLAVKGAFGGKKVGCWASVVRVALVRTVCGESRSGGGPALPLLLLLPLPLLLPR